MARTYFTAALKSNLSLLTGPLLWPEQRLLDSFRSWGLSKPPNFREKGQIYDKKNIELFTKYPISGIKLQSEED